MKNFLELHLRVNKLKNTLLIVSEQKKDTEREIDYIKKKSIILEEQLKVLDKSPNNYKDPFLDLNILNIDPYIDFSKYYMMEVYNHKTVNDIKVDNPKVINYYKKVQKKVDIGSKAKVVVKWNVHQSNYTKELEKSIISLMAQKYDTVIPNPPYMGASGMSPKLSQFLKAVSETCSISYKYISSK